jgi:2-aminoethylphosphonate-pyruvate transaminase
MQGSGTFGVEAVMTCAVPRDGKWLILVNGAYGRRMVQIARVHGLAHAELTWPEVDTPQPEAVRRHLLADPDISAVAIVHCETTTGIMNPVQEVGEVVREHGKIYFVDAMSSFGGVPFSLADVPVDYLVSSANKCIEGVPGFSFCICRRERLLQTEGWSRTLSLDLLDQWRGLERNGQCRFTPPTHVILAFRQALDELAAEGGVAGRAARYRSNYETLVRGMRELGFREYLPADRQGHLITSFRYPEDTGFDFQRFYDRLNELGFVIYPGKVSDADCFRIGHIGRLYPSDMEQLLAAIRQTLQELNVSPAKAAV